MGFMDIKGLCSSFHQVLAMDENLDTSSLETDEEDGEEAWDFVFDCGVGLGDDLDDVEK